MSTTMNRFLSVFAAAVIVLTMLSACGDNPSEPKNSENTIPADTSANLNDETSADTNDNSQISENTTSSPDESSNSEEETDPLELANEIIYNLKDDMATCIVLATFDGEVSEVIDNVEVERSDGSVDTVSLIMIAPPYDTLEAWRDQMHKVFTDEHCKIIEDYYFGPDGGYHVYEGKIGFEGRLSYMHEFISMPFVEAEFVSDTELVAKPTIPDDYDINFHLQEEVVLKKENGEWKIDRLSRYDDSYINGRHDAEFARIINAEDIPPYQE